MPLPEPVEPTPAPRSAHEQPTAGTPTPGIRVEYRTLFDRADIPSLLAAIRFGTRLAAPHASERRAAPLDLHVTLEPVRGSASTELWWASGPVTSGSHGAIRYACSEDVLAGIIEYDERECSGIRAASQRAYQEIRRFQQASPYPYLLRMWNYLDAITEGDGDTERYRQFCVGRAAGLGDMPIERYPAASALGRQQPTHTLQIYWLAGRHPGVAVENPRQVSAYRYPRQHGPVAPSFARATAVPGGPLLVSGTASIVGHLSRHPCDPVAQLEETLQNLDSVLAQPRPASGAEGTLLKVYLRDADSASAIEARLRAAYPQAGLLVLAADICRRELLIEIECIAP